MAALRKQPVSQRDRKAREGRTSFCEQKEAKKTLFVFEPGAFRTARSGAKVFWFFFSKKNFLIYLLLSFEVRLAVTKTIASFTWLKTTRRFARPRPGKSPPPRRGAAGRAW
jgi:hypothetical protein